MQCINGDSSIEQKPLHAKFKNDRENSVVMQVKWGHQNIMPKILAKSALL